MCGICGTYGFVDRRLLERMNERIRHRGPDDEGYFTDDITGFAMRRLRVIDLLTGQQPIFNEDKSVVVVFNGEIYNFRALREELTNKGHIFVTRSDTETIVHCYEEYGYDFVSRLRGMFALSLWDRKNKRLVLARDRVGIKPLYYWLKDNRLIFCSELKGLLEYDGFSKDIDPVSLDDYLTYLCVPEPATIFKAAKKLEAGTMLICQDGKFEIKRYWDIFSNLSAKQTYSSEADYAEQLWGRMKSTLKLHLESDVPLGVFLSGGFDSSTIVSLLKESGIKRVSTFTIGFKDKHFDESGAASATASFYGTDHHVFTLDALDQATLEEIMYFFDEPFADSSCLPTYFVSKFASSRVKVALAGDGGDEIFGGYGNYKADKIGIILRHFPLILAAKAGLGLIAGKNGPIAAKIRSLLELPSYSPCKAHLLWLACFLDAEKKKLYTPQRYLESGQADLKTYLSIFNKASGDDFLNACMAVDIRTVLVNDYLTKVDRMSMAHSLEVRVPFLDHQLVEFSLAMPSSLKIRGFATKYILRKLMKDRLPAEVLKCAKKGFSVPLSAWFKKGLSNLLDEYLGNETLKKRSLFNHVYVDQLKREHKAGAADHSRRLWVLLCLEIWQRRYID